MKECKCEEVKFDPVKWSQMFSDNYYGKTEQAIELSEYVKSAFKGGNYIPWAVMQRMLYQQDPYAEFKVCSNSYGTGFVFTDEVEIATYQESDGKKIETRATAFSHTVKVKVTFLGKTVEEVYAIQDSKVKGAAYTAPKAYDQNLVNNAIKRAFSKAASLVSGLALSLYENGDLQFETTEPNTIPVIVDKLPVINDTLPVVEDNLPNVVIEETLNPELFELATYLIDNKNKLEKGIKMVNTSVFKEHGFTITLDESLEELSEKLNHFKDPAKFVNAIKFQSGVK